MEDHNHASENTWIQKYEHLKKCHNEAYSAIEKAIGLEESGRHGEAILKYELGIKLIDEALLIDIDCSENPNVPWEKTTLMRKKMASTRKEVLGRISEAQVHLGSSAPPPSYQEAMSTMRPAELQTYSELGQALKELHVDCKPGASEIIFFHDNVRMYFISPDGTVSEPSEHQALSISLLEDGGVENRPHAYLQVGDWIYPLFAGVSPCYRTEYGAFIFPDVHSPHGSAIGLIVPTEADTSLCSTLNHILQCDVTTPTSEHQKGVSYTISKGLVKGAHFISAGLVKGAEKASEYMNLNTPRLMQNINPEPSPVPVSSTLSQGLQIAKNVTDSAVTATSFLASKIGCATMALGKYLAPHIQQQGTRLLSNTTSLSEPAAAETMSGALQIAAGAVEGFGTVYAGLENSASILGSSLSNNTVKIVEYKYGQPVGKATENTLYTVGNVITASNTTKYFTPKGLAKLTAKQTGKAVVEDYRVALREDDVHGQQPPPLNDNASISSAVEKANQ